MKYFYYLLLIFIISACSSSDEEASCEWTYDTEFYQSLNSNNSVCFPDGNSFEVKTIRDQFCCCFCECAWEGELEVMVETTDNLGNKDLFTFGSATFNGIDEIFEGYVVSDFYYLYDDEPDSLPLCDDEFNAFIVDLIITISEK